MGDSLYNIECSCVSKFVLIEHVLSTQVSDTVPVVSGIFKLTEVCFFEYIYLSCIGKILWFTNLPGR